MKIPTIFYTEREHFSTMIANSSVEHCNTVYRDHKSVKTDNIEAFLMKVFELSLAGNVVSLRDFEEGETMQGRQEVARWMNMAARAGWDIERAATGEPEPVFPNTPGGALPPTS